LLDFDFWSLLVAHLTGYLRLIWIAPNAVYCVRIR